MRDALVDAGYQVLQVETSAALATQVHEPALVSAAAMLLVLGGKWAAQCAVPISVAATMRQESNLAPTCVVLLYELGTLGVLESPELHHCRTVAMLEKPFELDVLREVARSTVAHPVVPLSRCYVPTHCPRCVRAFLTPLRAGAEVTCRNCGGLAHVVPGEVYRVEDADLFGRIEAAFDLADLPLAETFRIVAELGNVLERTRSPYTLLLRLLLPVPGLRFLEPTKPEEQERLVRGMGMLLAIAAARVQHGVEMPRSVRAQERPR